jgi:hypothetical protein
MQKIGTVQFASVISEAEQRWSRRVLPEIQTSETFQARILQDPILRESRIVLTGTKEEAVAAVQRLRSRWFPFHGLNENGEKRRAWLGDLQEVTVAEARERGVGDELIQQLLDKQALWLAVMRSPMKSTPQMAWKEAQKRWLLETKEDQVVEVQSQAAYTRRRHQQPVQYQAPSPERMLAETHLLAMEALNTAWLCETAGARLTTAQQTVLRLSYVTGLMEDHIADQMGLSVEAVGKLKRNSMAVLRSEFGK